jgi:hypothetical protein
MSRCARAWQRRQRTWLRSGPRRSENSESERTIEELVSEGQEQRGRQELMAREPKSILKVWQTTTSTALFG